MHIALVCEEYPPAPHGGTGSSYRDLAEGLVAAGHRATVVGISTTQVLARRVDENLRGVRVVRLPRWSSRWGTRLRGFLERRQLRRTLEELHRSDPFSAVECSDYNGWLSDGGLSGVPLILRIRGSNLFFDAELGRPAQTFEHRHEKRCLAKADHIASVSRYAAERTLALCGMAERPYTVLPNAVNTDVFSPGALEEIEPGLIVFVNSLNPKKGIEELVEAMNSTLPCHPTARLVIIGEDVRRGTESYVDELRERVRLELRGRLEFTGRLSREEIVKWLRRAAVACFPSHMETFGIAALEAMSVGRPTIFTRLGPGPEIVEDGITGILCDPRDPADIARCLDCLLGDPAYAESLGSAARARVLADFDQRGWVARNVGFYERAIRAV